MGTRLLSRTSVPPYTEHPSMAMRQEPEAVDAVAQERFDLAARRAERERRRHSWRAARAELLSAADVLLAQGLTHTSDVRVLERFVARLDRRLG